MVRWKLTFEYDGTHFRGWQRQPEGRTVEGVAESAFSTLYQMDIDIIGQGRTDAGVHATGQTAHVDLPDRYDTGRILHAMRGLLPDDVALLNAEPTGTEFHARFNAHGRCYKYQLSQREMPLNRHMVWTYGSSLHIQDLKDCAKMILGEHNFINFCIPPEEEHATTFCTIKKSEWIQEGEMLAYTIEGNRFLRHMVRRLVGTMIKVSDGSMNTKAFKQLLSAGPVEKKGHAAPAKGLVLEKVLYH